MPLPAPEVAITGLLTPTNIIDTYAVTDNAYNRGGWKYVLDLVERDAITPDRREAETTFCYVESTGHWYQLQGGITNADWVDLGTSLGGGTPAPSNKQEYIINGNDVDQVFPILHNKGQRIFEVTALDDATGQECDVGVTFTSVNECEIYFAVPPSTGEVYVVYL
jgi:hypothetical protein